MTILLLVIITVIAVELAFIARSLTAIGAMIVMLLLDETYKTLLNNRFRAYREQKNVPKALFRFAKRSNLSSADGFANREFTAVERPPPPGEQLAGGEAHLSFQASVAYDL
jgi:hypothetical protein